MLPLLEHGTLRLGTRTCGAFVERRVAGRRYACETRTFGTQPMGKEGPARDECVRLAHAAAEALEAAASRVRPGFDHAPALFALRLLRSLLAGTPPERLEDELRAAWSSCTADAGWDDVAYRWGLGPPAGGTAGGPLARRLDDLAAGAHPAQAQMPHVLVTGPGRCGTRWLLEAAAKLSAAARPTLALVELLPADALADRGDRVEWNRRVAACNAWFPASSSAPVLAVVAALPVARTVPFLCPPGEILVAKCSPRTDLRGWRRVFPRTRIVYVERDPRDILLSRRSFFPHRGPWALRWPLELGGVLSTIAVNRLRAAHDGDVVIRYEDMLADLPGQLGRLSGFLGLDVAPAVRQTIAAELTFESMAGRRRGELREGEYFRGGSDWTRELTRGERLAMAIFDPALRALGYPPTPRP